MLHRTHQLLLATALLTSACASSPPSQFYLLEAAPATATLNATSTTAPRLGIGAIVLPDYLNRPQIVLRDHGGRLLLRERERWAEPLEDGVRRTLGENLGQLLGAGQVVQLPAPPGITADRRLHLEIIRFDASTANEVWLHARWNIQTGATASSLHEQRIRIDTGNTDTGATIHAMNAALYELSRQIAASLDSGHYHSVTK